MLQEFLTAHIGLLYELAGVFVLFSVIICLAGLLLSRLDTIPLEDAIYFAFVTAFTVGFGDMAPKSRGARIVTIFLAFFGIILVGIAVAVAVHAIDIALEARNLSALSTG